MTGTPAGGDTALDLLLEAGRVRGRDELLFHLVNRSVGLVAYDRASAWTLSGRPRLLAVSGVENADARGAFASSWSRGLSLLRARAAAGVLSAESFRKSDVWPELVRKTPGLSALWQPLPEHDAGILFERRERPFSPADTAGLERLVRAYGLIRPLGRRPRRLAAWGRLLLWLALLGVVVAALALVRTPLRVVAVSEVEAKNPRLVSAPMEGVIESVLVAPGQRVEAGDELAVYDARLMDEELNISRRQVDVVEAELASARARGFSEPIYRGEVTRLEARLGQERARLEALEARYARRRVVAPVGGTVQLDDARAWRGRPVATGQAILWLVNPRDTRVKLWLPQDDRIDFDASRPIRVHLHALGGAARPARLTYVSSFAQPAGDGSFAFPAEAEWLDGAEAPPLGLRGSAFIYGQDVSLGYWLFRRPLAWFRRWAGL